MVTAGERVTFQPLRNDSDPDGDPLTIVDLGLPAHGEATGNAAGEVTYVPAAGFTGVDTFTYTIGDGRGGTATGTVTVHVTAARDLPLTGHDVLVVVRYGAAAVLTGIALHWLAGRPEPRRER